MENAIKNIIESPHPVHKKYLNYWDFLLDSYEGGLDYTSAQVTNIKDSARKGVEVYVDGKKFDSSGRSGNLFQHPKEREEDYQRRVKMSYYYNFCAPIIDIYTNHLFKQPIIEQWKNIEKPVEYQRNNIDRRGDSIHEFRKEIADFTQIYGHIFVICDSPSVSKTILSLQDQIDEKAFPYFTAYHPQSIINWALDSFGRPYWVVVAETQDKNIDPFNYDKNNALDIKYRLWTRDIWVLYDKEYNEVLRGEHNLGEVPIVCIFDKQSKKNRNFLGVSALADIAFISRDIYNSCSELRQILTDQTFSILAFEGQANDYSIDTIATNKGITYPEGRKTPAYVSPPPANAEVYFKHIDRQVSKIFQLAKLEGGSAHYQGEHAVEQSGVSKAWDFNQTNSALSKKAGYLEDGETKLWQLFAKWQGIKDFEGSIKYPNEFSIQSLNEELDEAEKTLRLGLGEMFDKEVKKAIVKKKFPRMPQEDLDKMLDEIDSQKKETEGAKIKDRVPELFRKTLNANSGGKKEE